MKKYLKIYWRLIKFAAITETTYRFGFFLELFVELIYMLTAFLGIRVLFWNVTQVAGWTFHQLLVLIGLSMIFAETITGLAFIFNLRRLPEKVVQGDLDLVLMRPLSSQFMVSLWRPYFAFLPSLIPGLVVTTLGFRLGGITFNPLSFFPFLLIFLSGLVISYSISMIVVTLSVWFVGAGDLADLAQQFVIISERPYDIFKGGWKVFFLLIIPIAFMTSFPARILMGEIKSWWVVSAPILAVIFLKGSNLFWRYALKHYQSASS